VCRRIHGVGCVVEEERDSGSRDYGPEAVRNHCFQDRARIPESCQRTSAFSTLFARGKTTNTRMGAQGGKNPTLYLRSGYRGKCNYIPSFGKGKKNCSIRSVFTIFLSRGSPQQKNDFDLSWGRSWTAGEAFTWKWKKSHGEKAPRIPMFI